MGQEIVTGPLDVYSAAVATVYEDIATSPIVGWDKIGTSASRHYAEEGVKLDFLQEVEKLSGLGGTEILKIMRTIEELIISFTLFDLSSGQWAKALNLGSPTDVAADTGTGGLQEIGNLRGLTMSPLALLIRGNGKSPDSSTHNLQIEIPEVVQIAPLEKIFVKGEVVGLKFELQAVANYVYQAPGGAAGDDPYGAILIGDADAV